MKAVIANATLRPLPSWQKKIHVSTSAFAPIHPQIHWRRCAIRALVQLDPITYKCDQGDLLPAAVEATILAIESVGMTRPSFLLPS